MIWQAVTGPIKLDADDYAKINIESPSTRPLSWQQSTHPMILFYRLIENPPCFHIYIQVGYSRKEYHFWCPFCEGRWTKRRGIDPRLLTASEIAALP